MLYVVASESELLCFIYSFAVIWEKRRQICEFALSLLDLISELRLQVLRRIKSQTFRTFVCWEISFCSVPDD